MPKVSVIMPVYNVERFVADAVGSVLAQSFRDLELLIIDDLSPDRSIAICEGFDDPRIRIIHHQQNRGLAGARNTGIRHARGELLAFIDSDDCWLPEKLALHVEHLATRPGVGVSFSRSAFIDEDGLPNHCYQMPRLSGIEPGYYLCRNPIGNGSAPVIRREVFEAIRYRDDFHGTPEDWYFDERLRRSEDIECWIRIALTTRWSIEGIPEALTLYRLNAGGLSANLLRQLDSWEQVIEKTRRYAPDFVAEWERPARAFQLRYLARQAIRLHDGRMALRLVGRALRTDPRIVAREPGRTLVTLGAAALLRISPRSLYAGLEWIAQQLIGRLQARRIGRDLASRGV
jgi:glycosyltransferase involved in cell wall biosynthesis